MKLIRKAKMGIEIPESKSDNTRVVTYYPEIPLLESKGLIISTTPVFKEDRRSPLLRESDYRIGNYLNNQELIKLNTAEGLAGIGTFISPSTYIGPLFRNNGKDYSTNVMSGEGTGNAVGNLVTDVAVFGLPGLIKKGFPISYMKTVNYSYPITKLPFRYVVNGLYDIPSMMLEVKQGINKTRSFLNSDVYKQTALHNIEEAKNMGLLYTPATESLGFQSLMLDGIKPKWVPGASYGGATLNGGILGHATEIQFNPASKLNYTAFHEGLHVGLYGNVPNRFANETLQEFMNRVKKEMPYLRHKVNEVFSNTDGGIYDFNTLTGEAAVNMLDVGLRLGIKWGDPYPSDSKLMQMLTSFKNSGDSKSGIVSLLRLNTPEGRLAVWRALNGTLFAIAPIVGGTYLKQKGEP